MPSLTVAHVSDDTSSDMLTGGSELDWFFAKLASPFLDTITDFSSPAGEQTN